MERRFDFVVFDWKGTLEPKSGGKGLREQAALKEMQEVLKGCKRISELPEIYFEEKRKMKEQEEEQRITFSKSKLLENVLNRVEVTSLEERQRATEAYYRFFNSARCPMEKAMYPGAEKVLQRLKEAGIPIALVRNSTLPCEEFQQTLIRCGGDKFFDVRHNVVLSGEVGVVKPHPKIFHAVLDKHNMTELHLNSPHRILFIGNETRADVVGGNNMGWKTVLLKSTEMSSFGLATWDIDSFDQLTHIIFPPS